MTPYPDDPDIAQVIIDTAMVMISVLQVPRVVISQSDQRMVSLYLKLRTYTSNCYSVAAHTCMCSDRVAYTLIAGSEYHHWSPKPLQLPTFMTLFRFRVHKITSKDFA